MMKFTFELDELKGSFTSEGDKGWKLEAEDTFTKERSEKYVSTVEVACILFVMQNPVVDNLTELYQIASKALKDFRVVVIP